MLTHLWGNKPLEVDVAAGSAGWSKQSLFSVQRCLDVGELLQRIFDKLGSVADWVAGPLGYAEPGLLQSSAGCGVEHVGCVIVGESGGVGSFDAVGEVDARVAFTESQLTLFAEAAVNGDRVDVAALRVEVADGVVDVLVLPVVEVVVPQNR
jgi:hypothetical protein